MNLKPQVFKDLTPEKPSKEEIYKRNLLKMLIMSYIKSVLNYYDQNETWNQKITFVIVINIKELCIMIFRYLSVLE